MPTCKKKSLLVPIGGKELSYISSSPSNLKSPMLITIGKMVSIGNTYQSQHILAVQIIEFPFILAGKTASQSNVLVRAIMFLSNTSGPYFIVVKVH